MWSKEQINALIELYKQQPVLYAVANPSYYDKEARRKALESIGTELSKSVRPHTTIDGVKQKINSLRTQFNREYNSLMKRSGSCDIYTPKFWCFERLLFLQDHVHARKSISNVPEVESSNIKEEEIDEVVDEELWKTVEEESETMVDEEYDPSNSSSRSSLIVRNSVVMTPPSHQVPERQQQSEKEKKRARKEIDNPLEIAMVQDVGAARGVTFDDADEVFGKYIAAELRGFANVTLKKRCKREIVQRLLHYQNEDDSNDNL